MKKYDYLIVGAGLFGAVFAYEMHKKGKKCLVIDRRNHIGGNIYCEKINNNCNDDYNYRKKHCLMVRPKKMLSVYSRISLLILTSIFSSINL